MFCMQTRKEVAAALCEAALIIRKADPRLIPDGGISMGYALPGAGTQYYYALGLHWPQRKCVNPPGL
ncbi:hypothetical protein MKMG_00036 [Methanogenium sp. MK-MG]|nr:hypothetical protein MKMG_00036 [Methanogenium sp. MK-MG]